jgi:hypothetical protein
MPMFNNTESFDFDKITERLSSYWRANVKIIEKGDSCSMEIDGETVMLSQMPAQIPFDDILGLAQYAYNWKNAAEELKDHNAHYLVIMLPGNKTDYERFVIQTMVLESLLATSDSPGIYYGSQSLLLPRSQYLQSAAYLKQGYAPIDLWIYLGVLNTEKGNSLYTYGMESFAKPDMEIIDSKLDLNELYDLMVNICSYVIKQNVLFNAGETLGYTADQKIRISSSKGVFLEGETLKLEI